MRGKPTRTYRSQFASPPPRTTRHPSVVDRAVSFLFLSASTDADMAGLVAVELDFWFDRCGWWFEHFVALFFFVFAQLVSRRPWIVWRRAWFGKYRATHGTTYFGGGRESPASSLRTVKCSVDH